jgi:hypothetical protein
MFTKCHFFFSFFFSRFLSQQMIMKTDNIFNVKNCHGNATFEILYNMQGGW